MNPGRTHTSHEYAQQLDALRNGLLLMAGRVEEMIESAVRALVHRDAELAERVIEEDGKVNRAEVEIDELCLLILARRQPMASDLRFIALCLKMVTDLERIGDLAVNICERALDMTEQRALILQEPIQRMATMVRGMLHDAIDAFVEGDSAKAEDVISRDDEVDDLYHEIFRDMLQLMRDGTATVERGIHLQSVAKWLERMADHSTNLAEQVIFVLKGKDIRHHGKLR